MLMSYERRHGGHDVGSSLQSIEEVVVRRVARLGDSFSKVR